MILKIFLITLLTNTKGFTQTQTYDNFIEELTKDYPNYSFVYGSLNLNIVDFLINDRYVLLIDQPTFASVGFHLFKRENMLLVDSLFIKNVNAPHLASRFISNQRMTEEAFYFRPLSFQHKGRSFFRNITLRTTIDEEGKLQSRTFPDDEKLENDLYLHFLKAGNNGFNIEGDRCQLIVNNEVLADYRIKTEKKKNSYLIFEDYEIKFFVSGNGNNYPNTHLFPYTINSGGLILIDILGETLVQAKLKKTQTRDITLPESFYRTKRIELLLDEAYSELYARLIFPETNSEELYKLVGSNFERKDIYLGASKQLSSSGSLSFKAMKIHSGKLYTVFTLKDGKKEFDALMYTVL